MNDDKVLKIPQIAEYLGCGISNVRKLIYENKLPYYKIGNRYYCRLSTLKDWLDFIEINTNK